MSGWVLIQDRFDSRRLLVQNSKNPIGNSLGVPLQAVEQSLQALKGLVTTKWSPIGFTGTARTMTVADALPPPIDLPPLLQSLAVAVLILMRGRSNL